MDDYIISTRYLGHFNKHVKYQRNASSSLDDHFNFNKHVKYQRNSSYILYDNWNLNKYAKFKWNSSHNIDDHLTLNKYAQVQMELVLESGQLLNLELICPS